MPPTDPGLKLLAHDPEDLAVVSAALQDAVGKIGDIQFESEAGRLTMTLNRFRWEAGRRERVRSAIQLGSVRRVQARRLRRDARNAVVELLGVSFEPSEPPGGVVTFAFAGGGDLRAEVECLDLVLVDISGPWAARGVPVHDAE
jgi:hypothetical protein